MKFITYCIFLAVCITFNATWAATVISVDEDSKKIVVTPYVQYLKTSESLTIEDVNQIPPAQFKTQSKAIFHGGFTSDTYWLKFTIQDNMPATTQDREWVLAINSPVLSSVKLHSQNPEGEWGYSTAGASESFLERQYKLRELAFPLITTQGQTNDYYLEISSSTSVLVPIALWSKQEFIEHHGYDAYIWGAYFGLLGAMLLYNLFLFIAIRDSAYFYYICFCLFSSISMASINGFGYQVLWPNFPDWNEITLSVIIPINFFFGAFFARAYLEMNDVDKRLSKCLTYFGYLCLVPSAFSLLTGMPLNSVVTFTAFVFVPLLVLSGIKAHLAQKRQARFFLIAWAFLLLTILLFAAGLFELITLTPALLYSVHMGIAAEVILLSLGLADRINAMKSERYAMQKQLTKVSEKRNEELVKALKSKDEFLATISHEMRTPIHGMLGAVTLLKKDGSQLDKGKLLQSAEQAGYDMLEIVENLLCFTELQSGRINPQKDRFDFSPLIERLIGEYQQKYPKDSVKVEIQNQTEQSWVETDKDIFVRLLGSVLDNAFKFTNEGQVSVAISECEKNNQQQLVISVSDTGIGIPESELQKVFKPFYQVDQSFSRHFGGLGIGLTICSRLMELIGGQLELKSTLTQGTTLTLSIPLTFVAPMKPLESDADCEQLQHEAGDEIKILIVEDNKTNMMVTKGFVKKLGYQVMCAENGKKAVELLQKERADLILMDCQMPVMNGFEATASIRQLENLNHNIPILAVTANAMMEDREKCLKAGMNDHIPKPIDSVLLQDKIDYWLQMSQGGQ